MPSGFRYSEWSIQFDASCPLCWPDGINAPGRPCTPSGLADRSLSSPRAWTIVLSEAHHPRDTARRTGRSVNAYALRQPDYLARGIGGMAPTRTVVGDGLDPACIEVHDTRFPPGNGSHAWLETTSGQGWCPEAVLRLTNLRGRACQQIRYRSRLSTSDA